MKLLNLMTLATRPHNKTYIEDAYEQLHIAC